MLFKDVCKIVGFYLFGLAITLFIPFLLAVYYQFFVNSIDHPQPHSSMAFLLSIILCLATSLFCYFVGRKSSGHLFRREGILAVVLIWFITPIFAGLPFYFNGTLETLSESYFEATSGFTTTGATTMQGKQYNAETGEEVPIVKIFHGVVYNYMGTITPVRDPVTGTIIYEGIEAVSKALLFWRSFTQWLEGMGIIVLFLAILPVLGIGGKVLFQSEVPGPIKEALTPRLKETAFQLWKIYLGLSLLEVLFLILTNSDLSLYEAITITFSTMSTGGFTVKNASIGAYDCAKTEFVVVVFMLLASINFSIYYYSLKGKFYRVYEPEFFLFLVIVLLSCCLASWFLIGEKIINSSGAFTGVFDIGESLRYGIFQIVSAITTTGFVTGDYDGWPYASQAIMLIVMFVGGMSGSTAGGIKIFRHYILFRITQYKVESIFRPEAVRRFKIGNRYIDQSVAIMVLCYFFIVISISVFSTLFFITDGIDPETSLSLVTLLINNIGIGFRMAAPTESFAFLSSFSLIFSSILMVLGRLEFLAVLAVLVPAFWRQNR